MLDLRALQPQTNKEIDSLEKQYLEKKSQIQTLESELDLIKSDIINRSKEEWIRESESKPCTSVKFEKLQVVYQQRKMLLPAVSDKMKGMFEDSLDISIDGSRIPTTLWQSVINEIAKLGLSENAITIKFGKRAKKDALTQALKSGDQETIEFIKSNGGYTPSVRLLSTKKK